MDFGDDEKGEQWQFRHNTHVAGLWQPNKKMRDALKVLRDPWHAYKQKNQFVSTCIKKTLVNSPNIVPSVCSFSAFGGIRGGCGFFSLLRHLFAKHRYMRIMSHSRRKKINSNRENKADLREELNVVGSGHGSFLGVSSSFFFLYSLDQWRKNAHKPNNSWFDDWAVCVYDTNNVVEAGTVSIRLKTRRKKLSRAAHQKIG